MGPSMNSQFDERYIAQPGEGWNIGGPAKIGFNASGPWGYAPDYQDWVANGQNAKPNMVAMLLDLPEAFRYYRQPEKWAQALKTLVETMPRSIEGLNKGLTVETSEIPFGAGGQMLKTPTNVTRARSEVNFTWDSRPYFSIEKFLEEYIMGAIMDPESKIPNVATYTERPKYALANVWAFTMGFAQIDPYHRKVQHGWIVTNMFPEATGDITAVRKMEDALETPQISVSMGGLAVTSYGVTQYLQSLVDTMDITNANPSWRTPWMKNLYNGGIHPLVQETLRGYSSDIRRGQENAVSV